MSSNLISSAEISWDKEFSAQEMQLATSVAESTPAGVQEEAHKPHFDGDELARTAGMLVENLKHETNPKFQNSQFMGLMKQLRDGEVVVDGNQMVENDGRMRNSSQINAVDMKGKGKERAYISVDPSSSIVSWEAAIASGFLPTFNSHLLQDHQQQRQQQFYEGAVQGDALDSYFRQENADYTKYWQDFNQRKVASGGINYTAQDQEWEALQNDWDRFEATSSGIRQLNNYQFQENNPYLLGDSSRTRHHAMHSGMSSTLEVGAFVFSGRLEAISLWS